MRDLLVDIHPLRLGLYILLGQVSVDVHVDLRLELRLRRLSLFLEHRVVQDLDVEIITDSVELSVLLRAEDIARALYALIDRASLVNTTDSELLQIVLRESKVYFGGGTTARQAAQAIDAKVQLYLAEQYG